MDLHESLLCPIKKARKDSVIAEVKWFYRVSELPEAVYLLLMEDRKKGLLLSAAAKPSLCTLWASQLCKN